MNMLSVMILVVVLMVGAGDGYLGDACRDGGDVGGDCDDGGGSDCCGGGWIRVRLSVWVLGYKTSMLLHNSYRTHQVPMVLRRIG